MEPKFADLHCHPHLKPFNWLYRPEKNRWNTKKYNPWWIVIPNLKAAKKGKRAAAYTQSDLVRIINGNLRLAFVSLYPLEQGWFMGRNGKLKEKAVDLKKVLGDNHFSDDIGDRFNDILDRLTLRIGDDKKGRLSIRDLIQAVFQKIPLSKVNYIQSDSYDHFNEFLAQRIFLEKSNNLLKESKIYLPGLKSHLINKKKLQQKNPDELSANGVYSIAKDGQHVKEIIDNGDTAFVYTVEGANVFNSFDTAEEIISRIREVKEWPYPIFFISFSHHFANDMAGHAHSIPQYASPLLDQNEGMNEGFNEKGRKIARYLLSIDEDGNYKPEEYGKRILIDVKHMSARARQEYYHDVITPSLNTDDPIPVIASHVAFSGESELDTLINNSSKETDGSETRRNGHPFNNWNINICDEDVIIIYKSKGLIGINLDQRVLGVSKEDKDNNHKHAFYVWMNIKTMMQVINDSDDPEIEEKNRITDLFCLGTDFDGFIDPLNKYPTVLEFKLLREDLIKEIENDKESDKLLNGISATNFADKFCFGNAYDFVVERFG